MSHLIRHRNKQNAKRILFLTILTGGILVVLFIVGLQSVINATVFINNFIKGKPNENKTSVQKQDFFGTLEMDEPPMATNSAQLIVSGTVTEYDTVEYFINNVSVNKEKISANDQFSEEIGKLKTGSNKVHVVVTDTETKEKKESEVYTVIYKSEKPKLEIETPKDGDKTDKNEITVKGKTDKDTEVNINNSHVVVAQDGSFTKTQRLQEGDNKLEIVATDIAGNEEKISITVKYEKED